ncbi:MAG: hypothetical protein ACPLYF_03040, partial [Fervidobacterium sp.]
MATQRTVSPEDTFNKWRQTTNQISADLVATDADLNAKIGNLSNLITSAKTNLVSAANELETKIGPLASLTTANKSNLTVAVNELVNAINNLDSILSGKIGTLANLST